MELQDAFHKWANGGKTLVAYGPRDEGGYSLFEYNGGKPQELFRSDCLEEIQAAFRDYYAVKAQAEKGMPWKVAGNHLVVCRQAPDGKFEVREYNSFKNRIEIPLERCDRGSAARSGDLKTRAEIEAAEHALSVDRADIRRLREIAGNHAMLTPEFFNLNGSGPSRQENGTIGIRR